MIKILLADDQCLMLEGIKTILKCEPEIEVVGTARDGKSAIAQVKKLQPDVVLIDIEMPKMDGIMATKYICKYMPDIKVIVLTSHKNQDYITQALQAGASSYVLKDSLVEDLKQEIYSRSRSYSYVEAKLFSTAVNKIRATNIVKYQEKITYLKKYRKSIFKPASIKKSRLLSGKTFNRQSTVGVTKASWQPNFKPYTSSQMLIPNLKTSYRGGRDVYSYSKFYRRKYFRKIIWLLLAIACFILSVIIF